MNRWKVRATVLRTIWLVSEAFGWTLALLFYFAAVIGMLVLTAFIANIFV